MSDPTMAPLHPDDRAAICEAIKLVAAYIPADADIAAIAADIDVHAITSQAATDTSYQGWQPSHADTHHAVEHSAIPKPTEPTDVMLDYIAALATSIAVTAHLATTSNPECAPALREPCSAIQQFRNAIGEIKNPGHVLFWTAGQPHLTKRYDKIRAAADANDRHATQATEKDITFIAQRIFDNAAELYQRPSQHRTEHKAAQAAQAAQVEEQRQRQLLEAEAELIAANEAATVAYKQHQAAQHQRGEHKRALQRAHQLEQRVARLQKQGTP